MVAPVSGLSRSEGVVKQGGAKCWDCLLWCNKARFEGWFSRALENESPFAAMSVSSESWHKAAGLGEGSRQRERKGSTQQARAAAAVAVTTIGERWLNNVLWKASPTLEDHD